MAVVSNKFPYVILLVVLLGCGDKENPVNSPPVASFEFSDGLDRILVDGQVSTDKDGDPLTFQWSASNGQVVFDNTTSGESFFKIPAGSSGMDVAVTLKVSDGKSENVTTKTIEVPAFSLVRSYGLGKMLGSEVNNNVDYDWYIDQSNTGQHSLLNCGPSSVTMAIKWFDQSFSGTAEEARDTYHASGGWWYTQDIIAYLNKFNVYNRTIHLDNISNIKEEIDAGNVLILCLDMFYVEYTKDPEYHVNKFYTTNGAGWGHFIVIKGYKTVDGTLFYEAYDPYSFNQSFEAGGLKGKDRYYSSANLKSATDVWWPYAIVIERTETPGGRRGVDVNQIIHMPGR